MATPIEGLMNDALLNLKQMIDVNTIVGDAVTTNDGTTIIPVSKVAFGFGAGGSEFAAKPLSDSKDDEKLFGGGCGGGVSVNPVAFLVVKNDNIRLLPVSGSISTADRLIDMIPDVLSKFNGFIKNLKTKKSEEDIDLDITLDTNSDE